ncbi:hypothetical protein PZA11_001126 [Diplocarpon coronariae]
MRIPNEIRLMVCDLPFGDRINYTLEIRNMSPNTYNRRCPLLRSSYRVLSRDLMR